MVPPVTDGSAVGFEACSTSSVVILLAVALLARLVLTSLLAPSTYRFTSSLCLFAYPLFVLLALSLNASYCWLPFGLAFLLLQGFVCSARFNWLAAQLPGLGFAYWLDGFAGYALLLLAVHVFAAAPLLVLHPLSLGLTTFLLIVKPSSQTFLRCRTLLPPWVMLRCTLFQVLLFWASTYCSALMSAGTASLPCNGSFHTFLFAPGVALLSLGLCSCMSHLCHFMWHGQVQFLADRLVAHTSQCMRCHFPQLTSFLALTFCLLLHLGHAITSRIAFVARAPPPASVWSLLYPPSNLRRVPVPPSPRSKRGRWFFF